MKFLGEIMRFVFFAAFWAVLSFAPVSAQETLSIEDFSRRPHMDMATLSPDGQYVAFMTTLNDEPYLISKHIETGGLRLVNTAEFNTRGIRWAMDDMIVITVEDAENVRGFGQINVLGLMSFDVSREMALRYLRRPTYDDVNAGRIVGIEPDTDYLLVSVRQNNGRYDLRAYNARTGRSRLVRQGDQDTLNWVIDAQGEAAARVDYSQTLNRFRLRVSAGEEAWNTAYEDEDASVPSYTPMGLTASGQLVVRTRLVRPGEDARSALYTVSLETGAFETILAANDQFELDETIIDPYTNLVIGARFRNHFRNTLWFDDDLSDHQAQLAELLPGEVPVIENWSRNRDVMMVSTNSGTHPKALYLYYPQTGVLDDFGSAYPAFSNGEISSRDPITYTSRDGVEIPAYLTLPAGDGPFPTVILPHGGPVSRDYGGFNDFAHFMASRGYAVLQPNFRGGGGFGLNWEESGFGEWGRGIMQDDLSDGVAHMVTQGLTDPDRVCIVGASYGGYAALAGAAFTPDLYACAVAFAPVSDLSRFLRYSEDRAARGHWVVETWNERFSGESEERRRDIMASLSPASNIEAITIPILVIHGEDDTVVPIDQSERFARAMRRADKPVDFIEIENGDHWLSLVPTRRRFFTELERFLAEHIGEGSDD
jgi:dipeptidyl aminopeptidase/acylaminoacyl peptidase